MKLNLWLSALLFSALSACSMPAITDSRNIVPSAEGSHALQLSILDHYVIPRGQKIGGVKITELSGLAWDEDEQLLYAISDKGRIYHFKLQIENEQIARLTPVYGAKLLDSKGKKVKKHRRDAEGLMVWNGNNGKKGDSTLIMSLEGDPRIIRFTPQGRAIENLPLPEPVSDKKRFRHANSGLESVTWHPKYGFMTAPEESLQGQASSMHTVYALKKQWSFPAYPAKNSSITAMDLIPGTNTLLVLERAWSGVLNPLTISLRTVDLSECGDDVICQVDNLKVFSSSLSVDNFEGMTHIKDNYYLIVSDDGDNELLRTILTLFKVE